MRLDHVILAAADLDTAQRHVERELGLPVLPGGRHEGQGTHNRIVPLGDTYLELIAVCDPAEAAPHPFGSRVLGKTGLIGWAVRVDDVDAVAARLDTRLVTIRRDGLEGRLTGVEEALDEPTLPFFIESTARPGEGGTERLTRLELGGDAHRLRAWLGGVDLPEVQVADGPPAVRAIGIGARTFSG